MKRYYLADVIGTGAIDDPYRAAVTGHPGLAVADVLPTDPATGKPLFKWALCIVSGIDHSPLLADARVVPGPDLSLDLKLSAMRPQTWSSFTSLSSARWGVDLSAFSTAGNSADSYRDVIRYLGGLLLTGFNENSFDVAG